MKKGSLRRKRRNVPAILGQRGARIVSVAAIIFLAGALLLQSTLYWGGNAQAGRELLSFPLPFLYGVSDDKTPETPESGETEHNNTQGESSIEVKLTDFDEGVSDQIRLELLNVSTPEKINLSGTAPRILIYHTHTTEAYTPTKNYPYVACGDFRTRQNDRNVVALGERLTKLLNETYGIVTLHDITDHEPPKLDTAYERSLVTMLRYKKQYPSLTTYIDIHRDAYGTSPSGAKDYVTIDGKQVARMMFVVGTGEGATGTGYSEMPDFASNYALAKKLSERLAQFNPTLVRDIRVKKGRYNQHVSSQCLLVEIGHNANTFEQALNAMDYLAQAIADVAGVEYEQESAVQTIYQFAP